MEKKNSFFRPVVTADGAFSGYGAVFDNLDSHRDVIRRGAFDKSLRAWRIKGRFPAMRLMHGSSGNPFAYDDLPVGVWTVMREDSKGLWVEGRLLALETDQGKRLLSLMRAGVLDGLSIGFVPERTSVGKGGVKRYLDEIDLRELSIVDEPSNDLARVAALSDYDEAAERVRNALAATTSKSETIDPLEKMRAALAKL